MASHAKSGLVPARFSIFQSVRRATPSALFVLTLAACNGGGSSTGPGAVSEGEAQALDEAAEMLDARQLPPEALPESPATVAPPEDAAVTETEADD